MTNSIPVELIDEILSHCTNGSLSRCALTNKTLLEFSRSHLYHDIVWDLPWRHPSTLRSIATYRHLLSHTRNLTIDFHNSNIAGVYNVLSRLVNDLLAFGTLECLTLKPVWSSSPDKCLRLQALLFRLVPMSSLIGISLFLNEYTVSPGLVPFISSPKLRDLSVVLRPRHDAAGAPTSDMFINPPLQFLSHLADSLDLCNIRRLVITFTQAEVVVVYIVKLFTACNNLTHLTLIFHHLLWVEEGQYSIVLSLPPLYAILNSTTDIPALFIPIQQLLSLTSLTLQSDVRMSTINKSFDFLHFIFQQIPPKAPLSCIVLYIRSLEPMKDFGGHPTLELLRSIGKSRHEPSCQLTVKVLHFGDGISPSPWMCI